MSLPSLYTTGGLSPPKLAPLSLEVESFLGISMTCREGDGNDGGENVDPKQKMEMVWKKELSFQKKGTYSTVKLKLALIGEYLVVFCWCVVIVSRVFYYKSVNLPYTLGFCPQPSSFTTWSTNSGETIPGDFPTNFHRWIWSSSDRQEGFGRRGATSLECSNICANISYIWIGIGAAIDANTIAICVTNRCAYMITCMIDI